MDEPGRAGFSRHLLASDPSDGVFGCATTCSRAPRRPPHTQTVCEAGERAREERGVRRAFDAFLWPVLGRRPDRLGYSFGTAT